VSTITFDYRSPSGEETDTPTAGTLTARLYQREIVGDAFRVVARISIPLVAGVASVELSDTDPDTQCWVVVEKGIPGSRTYYKAVSGDAAFVDLVDVDPYSLEPVEAFPSVQHELSLKAPIASPTFTGTVSGITKAMVGLGDVDNTSDEDKPISAATQTAIDAALTGTPGSKYRVVAGVLRNAGAVDYWQPINDSGHVPVNIDSVSTSTTVISIDYTSLGAVKVISFVAVPDEAMAKAGFLMGTSVGLSSAQIELSSTKAFADYVSYNGTTWVSQTGVFGLTFNPANGNLLATHAALPGANVFDFSAVGRGVNVVNCNGVSASDLIIQFRDWAGTVLTTANTDMKAFIRHGSQGVVNPRTVDTTLYPGSNIWFFGILEVA